MIRTGRSPTRNRRPRKRRSNSCPIQLLLKELVGLLPHRVGKIGVAIRMLDHELIRFPIECVNRPGRRVAAPAGVGHAAFRVEPPAKWAVVDAFGAVATGKADASAALQTAIDSRRTLVLSSLFAKMSRGMGACDVFLDDFCVTLNRHQPGERAWCRQFNTEQNGTILRNNGGRLWILGIKTRKIGAIIEKLNGG